MSEPFAKSPARRGRTLKLYLVDGSPSGVITAELGVSSVRAAVATRTALPDLIRREEATRTGIYLLVAEVAFLVLLYLFTQRYIIAGMTSGALKG